MPTINANGAEFGYDEMGRGSLAIFIHGYPLDASMWIDQLEGLGHLRRCVAMDLRGWGRSTPVTGSTYTMDDHAHDVAAVISALGEEAADIVALSMGGYIALALWELHPDVVRSLTLVDTRSLADSEEGKANRHKAADAVVANGRTGLAEGLVGALLAPGADLTARARLRSMAESASYEAIVAALRGMADRPDRTSLLDTITAPTLVVTGEEDALTPPEEGHEMATHIAGAEFKVVPGAGHLTPIERAAEFNELVAEFWG